MVGGSRSGKGCDVNAGDLPGQDARETAHPAEVRAAIVAQASCGTSEDGTTVTAERSRPTTGGAKGGRKANPGSDGRREEPSPAVPGEDRQGEEDLWLRYGAERGVWSQGMLEALERGVKGGKWFSLIDKVCREDVLAIGWDRVLSNAGVCGVDGITVERFGAQAESRLLAVKEHIERGDYRPQPIKRVWIDKPGSAEKRPLGIPTVRDRVVQSALKMVIEAIFEREFAPQSYGFRPGRSCKDALRRVDELLKGGHAHVVDIDIKGYFDSIPHDGLMKLVERRIADGRVLGMIGGFLKAGVMEGMESWEPEDGTPQGGVVSPLLANIYLDPLDWLMKGLGLEMVRYADDMVVLCRDAATARKALEEVGRWMADAGLSLHPEKTRLVDMSGSGSHFDFLGYRFWRSRKGKLTRHVRPKSESKLRANLKKLTKRNNGHSLQAIAKKIDPILRGWCGYFKHGSASALAEMDGWVRGRLRGILRKRHGGRGRGRGNDHRKWPNRYFDTLGLFNLEAARAMEHSSLRNGAKCAD